MSEVEIAFKTYEITSIIAAIIGSVFTGLMVFNALVNNKMLEICKRKRQDGRWWRVSKSRLTIRSD